MALNKNGSVLFAIFAMIFLAFLGVAITSMFTATTETSSKGFNDLKAFYLAQSGKEIAVTECVMNGKCQSATYKLGNGEIKVRLVSVTPLYQGKYLKGKLSDLLNTFRNLTLVYDMTSEGIYGSSKREIEFKFWVKTNNRWFKGWQP